MPFKRTAFFMKKGYRNILLCSLLSILLLACNTAMKIEYDKKPCIVPVEDYHYRLGESLLIKINEESFLIPKNFKTDLASIPRPLWSIYSPHNASFVTPAIIHDYFYNQSTSVNRREADTIFYYTLLKEGVPRHTAFIFWISVRAFGYFSFHK